MKHKQISKTILDLEIEALLLEMKNHSRSSNEYKVMVESLTELYKAKEVTLGRQISPDTIAIIAANLLGIGMIIGFEKANVVTSKALGFIMKGRV